MARSKLIAAIFGLLGAIQLTIASKKPNILFVLTDDQDWHMDSLHYMPFLQKYLINEGTLYSHHYCTVAICCPSRANLWTGRAAHNTNVTDVYPPYGGYPKVVKQGINDDYLPIWLQNQGYNTYYSGKLWNWHHLENYDAPFVNGFNGSDFLLDPHTYEYHNASMSRNREPPVSYKGYYSPDVVAEKAYGFLSEALLHPEPFFLVAAPVAPHSNCFQEGEFKAEPPHYAERHAHLFKDYKIPRTANFNPEKQGGVGWIKNMPLLNDTVIEFNDEFQRSRLRALQSVDEMVEHFVKVLEAQGELDNTYIFYTTDNGYHISHHRLHPGKECGYETDIHIPLVVRGPGVPAGHVSDAVTSHTDLSPTLLHIAGGSREDFDGLPIPLNQEEHSAKKRTEHINVEYWGMAVPESKYGKNGDDYFGGNGEANAARNNTYKSLRIIGEGYNLYYSVWCTGDKEYYDLVRDPGELDNYFGDDSATLTSSYEIAGRPFKHVVTRLDSLLMVLKSCKTETCHDPWKALHPLGDIHTLAEALEERYDAFYEVQPKVSFSSCELGYILDAEGPQHVDVWGDGEELHHHELRSTEQEKYRYARYPGPWHVWT